MKTFAHTSYTILSIAKQQKRPPEFEAGKIVNYWMDIQ